MLNRDGLPQHCADRPCLWRYHGQASYAMTKAMALCRLQQLPLNCQFPYTAKQQLGIYIKIIKSYLHTVSKLKPVSSHLFTYKILHIYIFNFSPE